MQILQNNIALNNLDYSRSSKFTFFYYNINMKYWGDEMEGDVDIYFRLSDK